MPAGVALMALVALLRLLRETGWKDLLLAVAAVGAVTGAFWFGRAAFEDLGRWNLLIFFVGVAAGSVLAGIPIAFAFGLGAFGYLGLGTGTPLSVDEGGAGRVPP